MHTEGAVKDARRQQKHQIQGLQLNGHQEEDQMLEVRQGPQDNLKHQEQQMHSERAVKDAHGQQKHQIQGLQLNGHQEEDQMLEVRQGPQDNLKHQE